MNIDVSEALRYLRAVNADKETRMAVESVAHELEAKLAPKYVWREFEVVFREDGVFLPDANLALPGALAKKMLSACDRAALLLCTLGAEFDRLLRMTQARDMARAVMLDACGSAYVEAGCAEAEREIARLHSALYLSDRFSPGYGDLPLDLQDDFLAALNGQKRLGVTALPSHLLAPAKSVTAIIGLSGQPQEAKIRGCAFCALQGRCAYRERGTTCAI
ncbi:MAG: methionine synthase [Clostridia bacterium]|nr:methionine synthase [Clostridia bacterium]